MYLIFVQGGLLGYTYNKTAMDTLKVLAKDYQLVIKVREADKSLPLKRQLLKSEKEIEDLVNLYHELGYSYTSWRYIQYNPEIIKNFSAEFIEKFEKIYDDLFIKELIVDLDNLLKNS